MSLYIRRLAIVESPTDTLLRQITGSLAVAVETGKLIRNLIGQATSKKDGDVSTLIEFIKTISDKITKAQPFGTMNA